MSEHTNTFSVPGWRSLRLVVEQHLGGRVSAALIARKFRRAQAIWSAGGWSALRARLFPRSFAADYGKWISQYDTWNESRAARCAAVLTSLPYKPLISIVVPVYNVEEKFLRAAIESVRRQVYSAWELILVDDCSTAAHIAPILAEYARADSRIRVISREKNGHIVNATNDGIAAASGAFIGFLDNDDELARDALACVVSELQRFPEAEIIYSDEDKLSIDGKRSDPYFKSDWNPELARLQNFVCHFTVCNAAAVKRVGALRVGYEGAQDWDLILRIADQIAPELISQRVRHIPHILYHWRMIPGSTAQATSEKPYVLAAQQRTIGSHLERIGIQAKNLEVDTATAQVRFTLPIPQPAPAVTIIIPTRDRLSLLRRCVESILQKSTYPNFSITIVDNGSVEDETLSWFQAITHQHKNVSMLRDDGPFNYSRLNNKAAALSKDPYLLLCNNDLEVISPDWIERLVGYGTLAGVGAVGARLLFPNDTVQHAGVVTGISGVAGHPLRYAARWERGYFGSLVLSRTVSVCTAACLLVNRAVFETVGGFDEQDLAVAFNDVDLCLKINAAGKRVVYCAEAELYHHESASRGSENTTGKIERFEREVAAMKTRWGEQLLADPFYNPNLTLHSEACTFAYPPRRKKSW